MRDIERLLDQAAFDDIGPAPLDAIVARSTRRRRTARAWAAGGAAVAVLAVATLATGIPDPSPAPVIDTPEYLDDADVTDENEDAAAEETAVSEPATLAVTDLDTEVFVVRNGALNEVRVVTPDGDERLLPLEPAPPSAPMVVPDGLGGFSWQSLDDAGLLIRHVDAQGVASELVESSDAGEQLRLVGRGDHALVTRYSGGDVEHVAGELISVPPDSGPTWTVHDDLDGANAERIVYAAGVSPPLYGTGVGETSDVAVVHPLDGEPTAVFAGGDATGEYVQGVAVAGEEVGIVLVERAATYPDDPEARLLVIDLRRAEVMEEVPVPLTLGAEDSWQVARDASAHGSHVLINREAQEAWSAPLIYDLDARSWTVLADVEGRAALAKPTRQLPTTACGTEDGHLRDAPPDDDGNAYLYRTCEEAWTSDGGVPVFRLDADTELTGNTTLDAEALLQELLDGPTQDQHDRGYESPTPEEGPSTIIQSVDLHDGLLVVDLQFPERVLGGLTSTHASSAWHASLLGTLLQLNAIEEIELRHEGSCVDYAMHFQWDGCQRYDHRDAPWVRAEAQGNVG